MDVQVTWVALETPVAAANQSHATSGALAGAGGVIAGSAANSPQIATVTWISLEVPWADTNSTHATSSTLAGAGATTVGSASAYAANTKYSTGALSGAGATTAGSATLLPELVITGGGIFDLTTGGTAVTGGGLTGGGATIVGTASVILAVPSTTHPTYGSLVGGEASVIATAGKVSLHATTGAIAGVGARLSAFANPPYIRQTAITYGTRMGM